MLPTLLSGPMVMLRLDARSGSPQPNATPDFTRRRISASALTFACALLSSILTAHAQYDDFSSAPISYSTTEVHDAVAQLARQLEAEEVELAYSNQHGGYLKAVLELLDISVSSQTLVFSKTSMQQNRISPHKPRAIYFNDDVYVGFCQSGKVLEFAATDAQQGAIFYTLEQTQDTPPRIVRDRGQCLTCHSSNRTQDVPGYLVRSVFPNAGGYPEYGSGTFTTDHTSPFEERWGGWYVTGTHGEMRHMGNAILRKGESDLDRESHANLTSLTEMFSTASYLAPHSDIVALMVLEHQTQMHNALTWANYEARKAIHQSEQMNAVLDRPQGYLSESCVRRINQATDRVLKHLLMCDEFLLTSPVAGTSSFTEDFQARGIRDSQQRSLRDLDLAERMFRYPCSYMIYSEAFAGLPDQVRQQVLAKLKDILHGNIEGQETERYSHITEKDRQNIMDILTETHPEFSALMQ